MTDLIGFLILLAAFLGGLSLGDAIGKWLRERRRERHRKRGRLLRRLHHGQPWDAI